MRIFKTVVLVIFVLLISPCTKANEQTDHYEIIQSKHLNEQRRVLVILPPDYAENSSMRYPVVYVLGALGDVPMLKGLLDRLQKQDAAPQTIIAMIENTDRMRDLTPTVNQDPRGPVGQGGGGDKYLDFIEMELIPHMDKTFRTHDFKVVHGSSIGGLLVIHALQSRPHLFQGHMAFSPAVWWGDRTTVKQTKAFIAETKHLDNYLYMNIGEESGDMRVVYDDFYAFMTSNIPSNFVLKTDAFNSVAHALTAPAGLFNAYSQLFLSMQIPITAYDETPQTIDVYYQRLSTQRGVITTPPEPNVRQLGYMLVSQGKIDAAIEVFKHNVSLHPDSPDAQYGVAYGYDVKGDFDAALLKANKALAVADKSHAYYDFFVNAQKTLSDKVTNKNQ